MKILRGYLTAAIFGAITWVLMQFGQRFTTLVDMIYPYVIRTLQGILAQWSGGVGFSVWQAIVYCGIILALTLLVVMVIRHWNPIRVTGWVLTVVSIFSLLNTLLYGLNEFAGPLAEDLRMETVGYAYSAEELEKATI